MSSAPRLRPAVAALAASDEHLARVVATHGQPPTWSRPAELATLVLFILEQQISLDAARAHFRRLTEACGGVLGPDALLALDDDAMLAAGVSRQKRRYVRALAAAVADGEVDLAALHERDDAEVRRTLTSVTGIGAWTADCYLLFCLDRPDVWPVGDIALQRGAAEVLGRGERLTPSELAAVGDRWRPHRSEAARLLWHHYLVTRGRGAGPT